MAFTLDYIREHQLIGQIWRLYDGSDVVDDSTVVVHFREPVAYYQSLNFAVPPVLPRHIWHGVDEPRRFVGAAALVGSGMFAFDAWDTDARVAYLRRSAGPGLPEPPIDRVEIHFFSSPGALVLALRRGDIDVIMGAERHVSPAFLNTLIDAPGVSTLEIPAAAVPLTLVFNGARAPTGERAFRQAIALALDGQTLVQTVLRGRGQTAERGFVPPGSWTYAGPFPPLAPDSRRAAALLDSLGYVDRDGDGLRESPTGTAFSLPLIPQSWQSSGDALRATEVLVHQLRQVGLAATVDKHVVDREYELLWDERDYVAYVGHTTPTATRDGGHVYFADYKDFSYGTFADSSYHALLDRITEAPNETAYLAAVAEAQKWNARQLPGIALAWGTQVYAWRSDRFADWSPVAGEGLPSYASWSTVRPVAQTTIDNNPGASPSGERSSPAWWLATGLAIVMIWRLWRRRAN